MSKLTVIAVGKLKDNALKKLEENYLKRITSFKINIIEIRPLSEDRDKEAKKILEHIKDNSHIILLSENGKSFDSPGFANYLSKVPQNTYLVFGGASGHGQEIIEKAHDKLSLSPLTYAHQLARVVLIEQLYRAHTLISGHPYHK